jgi:hypothetical protein
VLGDPQGLQLSAVLAEPLDCCLSPVLIDISSHLKAKRLCREPTAEVPVLHPGGPTVTFEKMWSCLVYTWLSKPLAVAVA